jgi:DNA-binding NarL/FixJ family response regulator
VLAKPISGGRATNQKARIFLVDDHPMMRQGLAALINKEPDLEVCGEADGADDTLGHLEAANPHLLIADLSLQDGNGIDLIKDIRIRHPAVKVVVSSMHDEMLFAERVLRAGALGYISKAQPPKEVLQAIRQVLQGKIFVSKEVAGRLSQKRGGQTAVKTPESPMAKLSNRELTIFELIGQGMTTRDIAGKLFLSIKTVETHREHIKTKLNLANAVDLVHHALCWQLERGGMTSAGIAAKPAQGEEAGEI